MKKLLVVLSFIALTSGCKKDAVNSQNACTAENPLDTVEWFRKTKNGLRCTNISQESLVQATYRNQLVFYVNFTCANCDYVFRATLLDCEGRKVRTFTNTLTEMQDFENQVVNRQVLYICKP